MTEFPADYAERVYAGVLGKMIGVYLGRPIEGWSYERIRSELGEIGYYVNARLDPATYETALVVADDDISGTFVFARALTDLAYSGSLSSEAVGKTWLNYIVEGRSILWWGGVGTSTEHTAYLRLKQGIAAPRSGSAALNGEAIAAQIGGRIFIDGWALVSPGEPEQAAWFAEQAARVSHDRVAVHSARLIAAMEAQAFVEADIGRLLDIGLRFVPPDSPLRRVIGTIRGWHAADSSDWHRTRARIAERYGYQHYGGTCHVVPNDALLVLGLLYGEGKFGRSLSIVCSSGWDTDCNAGNLGCLLGIRGGLAAIGMEPDWRGPMADRMFLPAADGGGAITDAVIEAQRLVQTAYVLAGRDPPNPARRRARFDFAFPGSMQGFAVDEQPGAASGSAASIANAEGPHGGRGLAVRFRSLRPREPVRVGTPTFFSPHDLAVRGYRLIGCPTLYSGQEVNAWLGSDPANTGAVIVRLYCAYLGTEDRLEYIAGPQTILEPETEVAVGWRVPDTGGAPICRVGMELAAAEKPLAGGSVYLYRVDWDGAPETTFRRPDAPGCMWRHAWVDAADQFSDRWQAFRISHASGCGMVIQGAREWRDYEVAAELTPHLAKRWGLAARVGGLRRFYAVIFDDASGGGGAQGDRAKLVRARDEIETLAESTFPWTCEQSYPVRLSVRGGAIEVCIGRHRLLSASDPSPLGGGGIALLCEEGSLSTEAIAIRPLRSSVAH